MTLSGRTDVKKLFKLLVVFGLVAAGIALVMKLREEPDAWSPPGTAGA